MRTLARPTRALLLLALLTLVGCSSTKTYTAYAGEPPAEPATLLLRGDVRVVSLNGTPAEQLTEGFEIDSVQPTPPGDVERAKNPSRRLLVDPGRHTLAVGLARRWMPLARETHIALVLLTNNVSYTAARYPGSDHSRLLEFEAVPGGVYTVDVDIDKRRDVWTASVVERSSGKSVGVETGRLAYDDGGTALLPNEWIRAEQAKEKQARKNPDEFESAAVKPKAPARK